MRISVHYSNNCSVRGHDALKNKCVCLWIVVTCLHIIEYSNSKQYWRFYLSIWVYCLNSIIRNSSCVDVRNSAINYKLTTRFTLDKFCSTEDYNRISITASGSWSDLLNEEGVCKQTLRGCTLSGVESQAFLQEIRQRVSQGRSHVVPEDAHEM